MSLLKKIGKNIDSSILDFVKEISSRYDIDQNELMDIWKKTDGGSSIKKPKKKTAYQNFSNIIRKQIKDENPDFDFGQISKEISKKWKEMDDSEKNTYKDMTVEGDVPNFKNMKVAELRELCDKKGLNSKGKKIELIDRLMNHSSKASTPMSKASTPMSKASTPMSKASTPMSKASTPMSKASPMSSHSLSSNSTKEENSMDFSTMKLPEIKKICKEKGLNIKGKNKNDLIELLIENQNI